MPKFTVHYRSEISGSQTVEVDGDAQDALTEAEEQGFRSLCHHCSGWGQDWSRDESGEWEPIEITDENGESIWVDRQQESAANVALSVLAGMAQRNDLSVSQRNAINRVTDLIRAASR